MSLSVRFETSHRYSFNGALRLFFKIVVVPEVKVAASGIHYILLIDTSDSMVGPKFDATKKLAFDMLRTIPPGNVTSLISFDSAVYNLVEISDPLRAASAVSNLKEGGETSMYSALRYGTILAHKSGMPGYVILLTDGFPSDLASTDAYDQLPLPKGYRFMIIGVGKEYNEDILKLLADRTGGTFYHVSDPARELASVLKVPGSIGVKNLLVSFDAPSAAKFLNYPDPPLAIGVLEGATKIYGEASLPARYEGDVVLNLTWEGGSASKKVSIKEASDSSSFVAGINRSLVDEYKYYEALRDVAKDPSKLSLLKELSEKTRRTDLTETTKRIESLLGETKSLTSELTKAVRS